MSKITSLTDFLTSKNAKDSVEYFLSFGNKLNTVYNSGELNRPAFLHLGLAMITYAGALEGAAKINGNQIPKNGGMVVIFLSDANVTYDTVSHIHLVNMLSPTEETWDGDALNWALCSIEIGVNKDRRFTPVLPDASAHLELTTKNALLGFGERVLNDLTFQLLPVQTFISNLEQNGYQLIQSTNEGSKHTFVLRGELDYASITIDYHQLVLSLKAMLGKYDGESTIPENREVQTLKVLQQRVAKLRDLPLKDVDDEINNILAAIDNAITSKKYDDNSQTNH